MQNELTTAQAAIEIVKQVGFPVVVACWFMFRTDRRLEALTSAINKRLHRDHDYREED